MPQHKRLLCAWPISRLAVEKMSSPRERDFLTPDMPLIKSALLDKAREADHTAKLCEFHSISTPGMRDYGKSSQGHDTPWEC